ncbi:hypothetical protein BSKO_01403 [Bryopsis sp. KO-2023]|nr:hypothetical protein BSKO_01403 [Bryopsis sp. KO-2023]
MARGSGPRPEGTDGSDFGFRMVIHDRYKFMADLRKYNKILAFSHVPLLLLSCAWCSVGMLAGHPFPNAIGFLVVLEFFCLLSYFLAAPGTGREKLKYMKMYGFLIGLIAAEHILTRYWYHVRHPKDELYPKVFAHYLELHYGVTNTASVQKTLEIGEATLDGVLWVILIAAAFVCRSYVLIKRNPAESDSSGAPAGESEGGQKKDR